MKEFVGPFDFRDMPIAEAREAFSHDWRKHFPSTKITLQGLWFMAADQTHIIFSPEFELAGAGATKEDAHCKFIITLNGLYGHYLLGGTFPNYKPIPNGLSELKKYLQSIGWRFFLDAVPEKDKSDKITMPILAEFIKRQPLFLKNVLEKVEVFDFKMEVEFPDVTQNN